MFTKAYLVQIVALALLGGTVPARSDERGDPPTWPEPKTRDELAQFDIKEVVGELKVDAPLALIKPDKKDALDWSCQLSAKEIAAGDTLTAEVTVRNPSDKYTYRFSPPARGFFVSNLQVWHRKVGEKAFKPLDGWGKYPGKIPRTGVP